MLITPFSLPHLTFDPFARVALYLTDYNVWAIFLAAA